MLADRTVLACVSWLVWGSEHLPQSGSAGGIGQSQAVFSHASPESKWCKALAAGPHKDFPGTSTGQLSSPLALITFGSVPEAHKLVVSIDRVGPLTSRMRKSWAGKTVQQAEAFAAQA